MNFYWVSAFIYFIEPRRWVLDGFYFPYRYARDSRVVIKFFDDENRRIFNEQPLDYNVNFGGRIEKLIILPHYVYLFS